MAISLFLTIPHALTLHRSPHLKPGIDLSCDPLALQRLHEAAETAKVELSSSSSASISLPYISADASGPKHMEVAISRAKLDALIENLLDASVDVCRSVLADTAVRPSELDAVLLVGGTARCAAVEERVARLFGRPPLHIDRPEESIAIGAALHAQRLREQQYAHASRE